MTGIDHIRALPFSVRIQLVEDFWDTIAAEPESVRLSEAQTLERDRRLDQYDEAPGEGVEWSALKARILKSISPSKRGA